MKPYAFKRWSRWSIGGALAASGAALKLFRSAYRLSELYSWSIVRTVWLTVVGGRGGAGWYDTLLLYLLYHRSRRSACRACILRLLFLTN